ncbi:hypothetical protein F4777DRAFT_89641 [Nemania sp. FL0916]|nr:hypothetical protein F4777DRAFT_89641 [Nemania sp. FL0916]
MENIAEQFSLSVGLIPGSATTGLHDDDLVARRKHHESLSMVLDISARSTRYGIRRKEDYSSDYWKDLVMIEDHRRESKKHELNAMELEYTGDGNNLEDFFNLRSTVAMKAAILSHERRRKLFEQLQQQSPMDGSSLSSRTLMSLFTTSRRGLNLGAGNDRRERRDQRERKDQRTFNKSLIRDYELKHPTDHELEWSVAVGDYQRGSLLKAAHIYPYSWGQTLMTEFFGEECADELLSSRNGLKLPFSLVRAMNDWAIVIVPDIEDDATVDQAKLWSEAPIHEYKFRVLDPTHPQLDYAVKQGQKCPWEPLLKGKDLDQVRLQFRGDHRPRARYLWFWFCCAVLKKFWNEDHPRHAPSTLGPQIGKGFWGTRGPYMRRDFLLGIVEEIGRHEGQFLLDGAKPAADPEDNETNKAVVDLLNQNIISRFNVYREIEWTDGYDDMGYYSEDGDYRMNIQHGSEDDAKDRDSDSDFDPDSDSDGQW